MHSFIVTGSSKAERQTYIKNECKKKNTRSYDTVTLSLEEQSIGIEDVLTFQKRLTLLPYASPYTFGIIYDAEYLTTQAQQALLKTLEEPPPHVCLYLECSNSDALLATIRSRCQQILVASDHQATHVADDAISQQLQNIVNGSFASHAAIVDGIASSRDATLLWTQQAILLSQSQLKDNTTRRQGKILLRLLFHAKEQLEANVTPKLVLDVLCIEFHALLKESMVSQTREE